MNRYSRFTLALLLAAATVSAHAQAPKGKDMPQITEAKRMKGYKQEKQALSPAERDGVTRLGAMSVRIVQRYLPRVKADNITAHTLDRAYSAWLKDKRADRPTPARVIPALGVRLAMVTLKTCKGTWYHVKDNYGEALAVEFKKSAHQVYPIDSVNKRYERHERGFFVKLHKVYLLACHDKLK